ASDVPRPDNDVNFTYVVRGAERPQILTMTEDEYQNFNKSFKCPQKMQGCRLAFFNYQGQLISPDGPIPANHFRATIAINTPSEDIGRSYIPELLVSLEDTNEDSELRVLPRNFPLNSENLRAEVEEDL